MISTWAHTKTYNHGFVVAPISLWLIWTRRSDYRHLYPSLSWLALIFAAGFGLLWLMADLSHVLVGKQFAVVGMLISSFWAVIGNRVAANILFPLFFLFFMVPVGDQLVDPLMHFTADFTVGMLRFTGLAVYREGTFFNLTSGNWSVVEACSGINYLIASLTLGFVYAYLNFASYWKRAVFMVLSGVVPIIANGFRAYMIVMIGHLSDMKLAVGVDHIIYGGIFFGLVMLTLFYVGSFWRDSINHPLLVIEVDSQANKEITGQQRGFVLLIIALGFLILPQATTWLAAQQAEGQLPDYLIAQQIEGWHSADDPNWGWSPKYYGAVAQKTDFYADGSRVIGVYHASFGKETQGAELINSQNTLIYPAAQKQWRIIDRGALQTASLLADESVLNRNGLDLVVLEWYQIGDKYTANGYLAKWYQLKKRLSGDAAPEMKVVVWTQTEHDHHDSARTALNAFMAAWFKRNNVKAIAG